MIVEKSEWKVPLESSKEHKKLWDGMIAKQKSERHRWFYTVSRFYSYIEDDIEYWMYFDEYDSEDSYKKWHAEFEEMSKAEEFQQFIKEWTALTIKDSMITTTWTEHEDLRVE
ncbi:MAG: hypothetical protein ACXABU_13335 [Candidatus Hodarchaeales archaeon]|jgi:hypothetical protein